ncbi:MAG: hypothetical protein EOP52_04000 [Sphingobacteriales bacterium]|nr:MAG: hypothetical protein EOP52_04000 [Sphingobacteriales bacterium]
MKSYLLIKITIGVLLGIGSITSASGQRKSVPCQTGFQVVSTGLTYDSSTGSTLPIQQDFGA